MPSQKCSVNLCYLQVTTGIQLQIAVVKDVLLFVPQVWDQLVALIIRYVKLALQLAAVR